MPVLPEVGSISTVSGVIAPCASMASIIETPMRSLTLAIGLKNSSLARMSALTPRSCGRRLSRTIGVSPMVSVIELKMRPRPGRVDAWAGEVLTVSCMGRSPGACEIPRLYTRADATLMGGRCRGRAIACQVSTAPALLLPLSGGEGRDEGAPPHNVSQRLAE